MKKLSLATSGIGLVAVVLFALMSGAAVAEDTAVEPSKKKVAAFRDERPDSSRGWMVVAKRSYWPLCYESLDHFQEAKSLIGTDKQDELAGVLDKCSAWLNLAASAAMTDGRSGVNEASDLCSLAADGVRNGTSTFDENDLNALVTLGLLCTAKSHVMRAGEADEKFQPEVVPKKTDRPRTEEEIALNKEVAAERMARRHAQYLYDAVESRKHMVAAQTYLAAAAEVGGFDVDPEVSAPIADVPSAKPSVYVQELSMRMDALGQVIEVHRKAYSMKLAPKL